MRRNVITIDSGRCTGCGLCVPNCPEGAIRIIDGKARLVGDLFCDGLGACLGHCPEGAIAIEQREAEAYDERAVMANIVKQGDGTISAHLAHLREHGQEDYLRQALDYLKEKGIRVAEQQTPSPRCGCPGAATMTFDKGKDRAADGAGPVASELTHWPVQLHLISPQAPHFRGADLLLAADCTAYALGDFHRRFLKGKTLAIACPKLDDGKEIYVEKLRELIDVAEINTLTVMIMQVPCCAGLLRLAQEAVRNASRKVPVKCVTLSLQGEVLSEQWV